jgi:hypothetical protein
MADGRGNTLDDLLWRADHPGIDPETGRPWWEVSEREEHRKVTQSHLETSGLEVARMAMGLAWQAYLACKHPDEWPGGTYFYEGDVFEAYHKLYGAVLSMESDRRHMRYAAEEAAEKAEAEAKAKAEAEKEVARRAGAPPLDDMAATSDTGDAGDAARADGMSGADGEAGKTGKTGKTGKGGEDDNEREAHAQRCKYCGK